MDTSYDSETLQKLQAVELEILQVVHNFCVQHEIQYSLAYGTLLGAVRHKGFIPWDDDVDLMMTREMYDKFIAAWTADPPAGYFLQTDENDPMYPNNFLKIRKKNTTFIQEFDDKRGYDRCGVFLDIFPADRLAPEGICRKYQYAMSAVNMLMTRTHMSATPGVLERMLFHLPKGLKKVLKRFSYNQKTKWNAKGRDDLLYVHTVTIYDAHMYFAANTFDGYTELDFGDRRFMTIQRYEEYLSSYFGDYMTLPPEEQRVNHRPLMIDFEHSYGELKNT